MIVGRENERERLLSLTDKEESQFCAVYGRRRVGKTYLVRETFNYSFAFQHTGVARTTRSRQLVAFRDSLRAYGLHTSKTPHTWKEAFEIICKGIRVKAISFQNCDTHKKRRSPRYANYLWDNSQ